MNDFSILGSSGHVLARRDIYLGIKAVGTVRVSNHHILAESLGVGGWRYGKIMSSLFGTHKSGILRDFLTTLRPLIQGVHEERYFALAQFLQHHECQGRVFSQTGAGDDYRFVRSIDTGRTQNFGQLSGIGNIVFEHLARYVERKRNVSLIECGCGAYVDDADGCSQIHPYHLAAPELQPTCLSH